MESPGEWSAPASRAMPGALDTSWTQTPATSPNASDALDEEGRKCLIRTAQADALDATDGRQELEGVVGPARQVQLHNTGRGTRQGASKIVASLRDRRYVTISDSATSGREKVVKLTPRAT
jgi:DNA-binding MarR family transcriptional regulator